jgi:proline racemase
MKLNRFIPVVDAHTEGNPERVVIGGIPPIPGGTMVEKVRYVYTHLDYLRTFLVHEPRGNTNMYTALVVSPADPRADFGIIYLEPGGYATMCGHGSIAICTVLVEMGLVEAVEPETHITLDTPAGLVEACVSVQNGIAQSVTIRNVPSFLYRPEVKIDVPGVGPVELDIAFGGNFYALLPAIQVGLEVSPRYFNQLLACGTKIWEAVNDQVKIQHPLIPEINCVNYTEFYGPPTRKEATLKNAVVVPPDGMDRSPCGTGTSAKMAVLYAHGELGLHQPFVHESIVGSLYFGELIEETRVGDFQAVIPTIRGSAYIMGIHQLVLDPRDPFPAGFALNSPEKLYGLEF